MLNALSSQPGEVGWPDDCDTRASSSRPYALQDPVFFATIIDFLKLVAPHLVLTGCIEAMKTALTFGHPVVALACNRYSRQHWDHKQYTNLRHATHLHASCGDKWDVAP